MTKMERAEQLRQDQTRHYNCCASVVIPFAEECGLDDEQAFRLCEHFGGGMRMGSVCGAAVGGLMVLGMLGKDETTAAQFRRKFREQCGNMECAKLLAAAAHNGEPRKHHCDRMVYTAISLVEELL